MAIAIRGTTPATSIVTVTTPISVTLTGARQPQAGDVLIIIHGNNFYAFSNMVTPTVGGSTTGVTAITGGSADTDTTHGHVKSYYYVVGSTGDVTVSESELGGADEEKVLAVYVLSGVYTSAPIDGSAAATGTITASTSVVAPAVSPSTPTALLICHTNSGDSSTAISYTPPGGMTETYDLTVGGLFSSSGATEQLAASGSTGTRTFTAGASRTYATVSIPVAAAIAGRTATVAETASATSITGTIPPTSLTGDYVIAQFAMTCTVAQFTRPSVGDGWVEIVAPTVNNNNADIVAVYGMFNPTVAPTGTSSAAAGRQTCIMQAWSGVSTSSPIEAATVTTSGLLPLALTGVSTASAAARLVAGVSADFSTGTWTAPGSMTVLANHTSGTGRGSILADEVLSATGATGTRTFTASTLQAAVGYVLALRPAAAPAAAAVVDYGPIFQFFPPGMVAPNGLWTPFPVMIEAPISATNVSAEAASGTGSAGDASVAVTAGAEAPSGTGAAPDAQAAVAVNAEAAAGTGAAGDATVSTVPATNAPAEAATGTGSAGDTSVAIAVFADIPGAVGAAGDALASVSPNAEAPPGAGTAGDAVAGLGANAEAPSGAGSALDGQAAVTVNGGVAAGTGTAPDASAAVGANAGASLATGAGLDAVAALAVNAEAASGTGTALDATVSTASITNAPAEAASGTGSAGDASVAVAVNAEAASGTGAAGDATVLRGVAPVAVTAAGTGSAGDASVSIVVFADFGAGTGVALTASVAYDATPIVVGAPVLTGDALRAGVTGDAGFGSVVGDSVGARVS